MTANQTRLTGHRSWLAARFSMDLLPVFEMLAGKCVFCNTDATAGNATVSNMLKCFESDVFICTKLIGSQGAENSRRKFMW